MSTAEIFFYFFAAVATLSALNMLMQKTALAAAVSLVVCFMAFSGLYVMLDAPFVAAMQVVVYAGAIMMLIVFVIMTVDTDVEAVHKDRKTIIASLIAAIIVGAAVAVYTLSLPSLKPFPPSAQLSGTISEVGYNLFTRHVLNFEMLSLLLLVALVGALILAKQRKKSSGE